MSKLSQLFPKLTKRLLAIFIALLPFLVFVESSLAGTTIDSLGKPGGLDAVLGIVMMIFSFVIIAIVLLAYLFALGIGQLLDSTFILDSGMGDTLHLIWEVMRNFVNVAFILILLIIAVMVILKPGSEGGLGLLKKVLPKFILALVFVNLTFFAGRFILTTNDVLATAVFTLPKTVSGEKMIKMPCNPSPANPESCRIEIQNQIKTAFSNEPNGSPISSTKKAEQFVKDVTKNLKSQKIADMVDKKNIALVLVTSMMDLENLVYLKGLGSGWDAAIGAIGAIVVAGAVGIIIFMLFLALIIRMVVLWLCIAISPLAALAIVLKEVVPGADMKGDFDLLDIFIKHAFMPTMVAIPLSIGLIMIFANNTTGFDLSVGKVFSLSDGLHSGNFFAILWWIASIVIIWFGTNEMIKKASPKFAAMVTDKIHGGVNRFVGAAAGTLKYAPIVPTWNKDGTKGPGRSMGSFTEIPSRVQSLMSGQAGSRAGKSAESIAEHFGYTPKALDNATFNAEIKRAEIKDLPSLKAVLYELVRKKATSENSLDKTTANKLWQGPVGGELATAGFDGPSDLEGKSIREILTRINGKDEVDSGDALGELNKNDKDFEAVFVPSQTKNEEEVKKTITSQTNIGSEEAGKNYKEGSGDRVVEKESGKNIEVAGKVLHEVTVKDEAGKTKTIYATQNDDKSWTTTFTKDEFQKEMGNLRAEIMTANDNTNMNALGDRLAEFKTKYGDLAMTEFKQIQMQSEKAKANLKICLEQEHKITDEFKSMIQ
ncbi:hypothetical protein K9N08_01650 [Candidatus Gracilibacteria bacterium]|nr:hypothetical protein [Candidatus Gracilibacteria bacterium]MCF7856244.1 hypothetical protein [Candidatus Gracilibacteria bacterium]MCF7896691.1 hypothetical protein [Candidatus Gracilibacteria bacterium]